jgi:predicted nucleic acid-binding protein
MSTEIVIDASVAAKWYLQDEERLDEAERLRRELEADRLMLVVPAFWGYEVASIFSKAVANRRMALDAARAGVEALLGIPRIEVEQPDPIAALDLARRFNRSVIDCFYLAIAEERGCDF